MLRLLRLWGPRVAVAGLGPIALCACDCAAVATGADAQGFRDRMDGSAIALADAGATRRDGAVAPAIDGGPPGRDAGSQEDTGDAAIDRCTNRTSREPVTMYLSADDSNSMASPVIARRMLLEGALPPREILRTYEFLNYYDVRYPAPEEGHVTVLAEMREGDAAGEYVLQLGVQAAPPPATPQARVITLVLDRSGSMSGAPIAREREAVLAIARGLRVGDIVSAVTWNTERDVPFENHVVIGPSDPRLIDLAMSLEADGGTDLDAGLRFGYEIARRLYDETRLNRVILISDGRANAGETEISVIDDSSEDADRDGIYLVGVGVGDGLNDTLMDAVTDAGRGAYIYLDSAEEAEAMFGARWSQTMEVALLDVRVELTLPWYMAITEFHGEEISGRPERVRPQHLAPGDSMVFHQVMEACESGLALESDPIAVRATYTRPAGRIAAEDGVETTFGELLTAPHPRLDRGDVIVEYAEGLARGLRVVDGVSGTDRLTRAIELADVVDPERRDPAMEEIRRLAATARSLL